MIEYSISGRVVRYIQVKYPNIHRLVESLRYKCLVYVHTWFGILPQVKSLSYLVPLNKAALHFYRGFRDIFQKVTRPCDFL